MKRILILALLFAASLPSAHTEPPPADSALMLHGLLSSSSLPILRWPDFSDYRTRVEKFYESSGYTFAWTRQGKATQQANALIEVLKRADVKGLNSEDYDGPRWTDRIVRLQSAGSAPNDREIAEFDLALTVCIARYVSDLHLGRVNPGLFPTGYGVGRQEFDLPGFLRERLTHATDVKAVLEGIEPPYDGYRRTLQVLEQYLAMAREDHEDLLPVTKKPVDPGQSYDAAGQLAGLLHRLGDLPASVEAPMDATTYDSALVDAVKHFQTRHGLDADGRLGKATFAQLNTPLRRRILQLQFTLERWRWVPPAFPRPPIVINIPEFVLRALGDSYGTELSMKIVVGKAYRHQTPVFAASMNQVTFRPYWNVPPSIQRSEIMPKLERDPSYLAKNRFEVVTLQDTVVTNGAVDQATLAQLRSGKLRIRQIPGPENALGLVAFRFPNEHDVYLHSTSAPGLLAKSRRDFSHGCIRAEKPQQLAEWVLRNQPGWTPQRIADAMNGDKTLHVSLDRPIPVLIVYATAVVLASGEVRFFEDIYGQDAKLEKLLAKGYPYPQRQAQQLPAPHAAYVHVNEIGNGIIAHATASKR